MMNELLPKNTHPEFYGLKDYCFDWHLVFYPHDENDSFAKSGDAAENKREGVIRDFMVRLQVKLKLRSNQFFFVAASEYGKSGNGHVHALISFDHLRKHGKAEKIQFANYTIQKAATEIWAEMGIDARRSSRKLGIEMICHAEADQEKMLSYLCKKELGRPYKHIFGLRSLGVKSS